MGNSLTPVDSDWLFACLKDRVRERGVNREKRERHKDKRGLPFTDLLPRWSQLPGLGARLKPGIWDSIQVSHAHGRDTSTRMITAALQ